MNHEDSDYLHKEPCPKCGSKDNLARYSDGHGFCFGCKYWEPGENMEEPQNNLVQKSSEQDFIFGEYMDLTKRKISERTCKQYKYQVGEKYGTPCHVANFYRDGKLVGQKYRQPGKKFSSAGDIADLLGPSDVSCCGGTPTASALAAAETYLNSVGDGFQKYVLLATDGAPACNPTLDGSTCTCVVTPSNCDQPGMNLNCLDAADTYTAAASLYTGGYPVYVIGVGASLDWATVMDEIANQGGTTAYYEAADTSAFVSTLQTIVGGVVSCEFDIDWDSLPPDASLDPNLVNFYGDGGLIPYDENCEDGSGWHWIDSDTVEFCEDACADLKSGAWETVTATFGCESIPIE